jgi:hypothetical protein
LQYEILHFKGVVSLETPKNSSHITSTSVTYEPDALM